jgi:hypothetical protein
MEHRQLTRPQLIDEIRRFNSTVSDAFLTQFSDGELSEYLDHLELARQKQLRIAGWDRPRAYRRVA